MCKVVATLKYLRANYSAQDSPERFLYEALSFLGMFRMIIIYIYIMIHLLWVTITH